MGGSHQPANDRNAPSFGSNVLSSLAVMNYKRSAFHQIARWVSADRELREENQSGARRLCLVRVLNDLRRVSGEVAHGWIDLAQRDLHTFSLMAEEPAAKLILHRLSFAG
jgi:hypothetical protein